MSRNIKYEGPGTAPIAIGCLFLSLAFMVASIGVFIAAWRWAF